MRFLRKVLRLKPKVGEDGKTPDWDNYYPWTHRITEAAKIECKRPFLVHRMLRAYFDEAWREAVRKDRDSKQRTSILRSYRSRMWWERIMQIPFHVRKKLDWTHARSGPPTRQWEDLFVETRGLDWRTSRDSMMDYNDWERQTDIVIDEICAVWDLPLLQNGQDRKQSGTRMKLKHEPHWPDE